MKKLLVISVLTLASIPAMAQHYGHHGHWHRGHGGGWNWVAPVLIGGVVGYEIARNQPPVVVQQQPVILQSPQVVYQQNCSPWTEVQNSDGTITRTRTCQQ